MQTNHQMNYYDFSKTLSAEGIISAFIHKYIKKKEGEFAPKEFSDDWFKWAKMNI